MGFNQRAYSKQKDQPSSDKLWRCILDEGIQRKNTSSNWKYSSSWIRFLRSNTFKKQESFFFGSLPKFMAFRLLGANGTLCWTSARQPKQQPPEKNWRLLYEVLHRGFSSRPGIFVNKIRGCDPKAHALWWGQVCVYISICSLYEICTYIYHEFKPSVGKYSIHGVYGIYPQVSSNLKTRFSPWSLKKHYINPLCFLTSLHWHRILLAPTPRHQL